MYPIFGPFGVESVDFVIPLIFTSATLSLAADVVGSGVDIVEDDATAGDGDDEGIVLTSGAGVNGAILAPGVGATQPGTTGVPLGLISTAALVPQNQ